jgi:hypothetical protein
MTTSSLTPQTRADIKERFQRLAAEWRAQSRHLSNTAQMALLQPYQRIIGMGLPAVPLILEELQREPDQWFWALEAITEENPVPPEAAGKVRLMAQAWIDWGKQRGLVAPYLEAVDIDQALAFADYSRTSRRLE